MWCDSCVSYYDFMRFSSFSAELRGQLKDLHRAIFFIFDISECENWNSEKWRFDGIMYHFVYFAILNHKVEKRG